MGSVGTGEWGGGLDITFVGLFALFTIYCSLFRVFIPP